MIPGPSVPKFSSFLAPLVYSFPFQASSTATIFLTLCEPGPGSSFALILHFIHEQRLLDYIHLLCDRSFCFYGLVSGEIIISPFVSEYSDVFPVIC